MIDVRDLYFTYAHIDATEEAVVNTMLAAQTMTGAEGIRATRRASSAMSLDGMLASTEMSLR